MRIPEAQKEVRSLWRLMCLEERVGTDSKFVVFSETNSHKVAYDKAVNHLFKLVRARDARHARKAALDSLGMKEVRGALGGRYIE